VKLFVRKLFPSSKSIKEIIFAIRFMIQTRKYLIASVIGVILFSVAAGITFSQTGFFSKAFSKTVQPNHVYEQNVSIRKYYNLTVRFRTSPSGSDLSFNDLDATVVAKDSSQNELFRISGINNGKNYSIEDKLILDSIAAIDSFNVDGYADNSFQPVNISFSGTKAYLTVIVAKASGNATVVGLIYDELTKQNLPGITISAFNDNADPSSSIATVSNETDVFGKYTVAVPASSDGMTYDFYISDYPVTP